MNLQLAYLGRSAIKPSPHGLAVSLAPNLRRDRVGFTGTLRQPLRFREAVSALHNIVISDLRSQPKDRSAYEAYQAEQKKREDVIRPGAHQAARQALLVGAPEPMPEGLEKRYKQLRQVYSTGTAASSPECACGESPCRGCGGEPCRGRRRLRQAQCRRPRLAGAASGEPSVRTTEPLAEDSPGPNGQLNSRFAC
ncbi:MAG TPA: hypothetical protein VH682_21130 [Gemmataceae bacterium]